MKTKNKAIKLIEPVVDEQELQMIQEVLESGWLTEGPKTREFEARIREFVGCKYAIATTSCTTALEIALRALHIGPGDEVIVPNFTHPATADVVRWVGAEPVLVDVDKSSYNIDFDEIKKAMNKKTKCVIPVSWGGNPLDPGLLDELKEESDISVVEDAACGLGAEYDGRKTGTMADATCFSFHPRKMITTGEGGMVTTDNEELAAQIESLKVFGMTREKVFVRIGTNYKLSDVLAAIGLAQMKKIENILHKRIELASNYTRLLEKTNFMIPPAKDARAKHVFQSYAAYIETEGIRDKLIQDLNRENIETQIGTYALSLQPAFKNTKRIGRLETSEKLYRNLLTLPICHSMELADQEYVVERIVKLVSSY